MVLRYVANYVIRGPAELYVAKFSLSLWHSLGVAREKSSRAINSSFILDSNSIQEPRTQNVTLGAEDQATVDRLWAIERVEAKMLRKVLRDARDNYQYYCQ